MQLRLSFLHLLSGILSLALVSRARAGGTEPTGTEIAGLAQPVNDVVLTLVNGIGVAVVAVAIIGVVILMVRRPDIPTVVVGLASAAIGGAILFNSYDIANGIKTAAAVVV